MKAIAAYLLLAAMLLSAMSAFAYSPSANRTEASIQAYRQWVGKSATQLVKALGQPDYTSAGKNGRLIYDYVREPQHVGPIATYQFVIGSNKKVDAARLSR